MKKLRKPEPILKKKPLTSKVKKPAVKKVMEQNLGEHVHLWERKQEYESLLSQESIPRRESELAPKLFEIFRKQKLPKLKSEMGNDISCDIQLTLPYMESNHYAQVNTAGSGLGELQPMAGQDTFVLGEQTVGERKGGPGSASLDRWRAFCPMRGGNTENLGQK
jgi:hypothetical protein